MSANKTVKAAKKTAPSAPAKRGAALRAAAQPEEAEAAPAAEPAPRAAEPSPPRAVRVKLRPGAEMPTRATAGASCFDLKLSPDGPLAARGITHTGTLLVDGDVLTLCQGTVAFLPTGVFLEVPEGMEGQVRQRSGTFRDGLHVLPGTVDADYRGEVFVCVRNASNQHRRFAVGDRVAQLAICDAPRVELVAAAELGATARGARGLGSTGK